MYVVAPEKFVALALVQKNDDVEHELSSYFKPRDVFTDRLRCGVQRAHGCYGRLFGGFFVLFVVFDLCGIAALCVGLYQRSTGDSLPLALLLCYVVSTLSGLYFFVFAVSARIRFGAGGAAEAPQQFAHLPNW